MQVLGVYVVLASRFICWLCFSGTRVCGYRGPTDKNGDVPDCTLHVPDASGDSTSHVHVPCRANRATVLALTKAVGLLPEHPMEKLSRSAEMHTICVHASSDSIRGRWRHN